MSKYILPVSATVIAGIVLLGACSDGNAVRPGSISGAVTGKQTETCGNEVMEPASFEAKTSGGSGGRSSGSRSSGTRPGGTTTSKPKATVKPTAKPPKGGSVTIPKTCTTEYELLVNTRDGIFEEDVTLEAYDLCAVGEKYPACREGK